MPAMSCPNCDQPLQCRACQHYVDAEQAAEALDNVFGQPMQGTDTGEARGSSGRQPMWQTDTSPAARTAFLDSLGVRGRAQAVQSHIETEQGSGTPGFIQRLADAERLVEACEADRQAAYDELRDAQADAPEQYSYRALTPEQLELAQRVTRARTQASRCESALETARRRLAGALADFDRASRPLPELIDDWPGLGAIDRDRRY